MLLQQYFLLDYITSFKVPANSISYEEEEITGISFGFMANVFTNISNERFKVKWAKLLHKDPTISYLKEETIYDPKKNRVKDTLLASQPIYWVANDGTEIKADNQRAKNFDSILTFALAHTLTIDKVEGIKTDETDGLYYEMAILEEQLGRKLVGNVNIITTTINVIDKETGLIVPHFVSLQEALNTIIQNYDVFNNSNNVPSSNYVNTSYDPIYSTGKNDIYIEEIF